MDIAARPAQAAAGRRILCAVSADWWRRHREALATAGHDAEFVSNGKDLLDRLTIDWGVECVVMDLALATVSIAPRFGSGGPQLIAFGSPTNAGFALGARDVSIIDDGDKLSLLAALGADAGVPAGVADLSDRSSARLGALGAEAERVAAALARLVRPAEASTPVVASATVRTMIRHRRARTRFFPAEVFGDPGWDMLLDLFAARIEGARVSVSSLCIAAAVPTTTALRWIRTLCDAGLFIREPDPSDARRAFVGLSEESAAAMYAYFATLDRVAAI